MPDAKKKKKKERECWQELIKYLATIVLNAPFLTPYS